MGSASSEGAGSVWRRWAPSQSVLRSLPICFALIGVAAGTVVDDRTNALPLTRRLLIVVVSALAGLVVQQLLARGLEAWNLRAIERRNVPRPRLDTGTAPTPAGPMVGDAVARARRALIALITDGEPMIGVEGEPGLGKSTLVRGTLDHGRIRSRFASAGAVGDRRFELDFDVVDRTARAALDALRDRLGGADDQDTLRRLNSTASIVVFDHVEGFFADSNDPGSASELAVLVARLRREASRTCLVFVVQGRRLGLVADALGAAGVSGEIRPVTLSRLDAVDAEAVFRQYAPSTAGHPVDGLLSLLGGLPRALRLVATVVEADLRDLVPRQPVKRVVARFESAIRDAAFDDIHEDGSAGARRPVRDVDLENAVQIALSSKLLKGSARRFLAQLAHFPGGLGTEDIDQHGGGAIFDYETFGNCRRHDAVAWLLGLTYATPAGRAVEPIVASYLEIHAPEAGDPSVRSRWCATAAARLAPEAGWRAVNGPNLTKALRSRWQGSELLALRALAAGVSLGPEDRTVELASTAELSRIDDELAHLTNRSDESALLVREARARHVAATSGERPAREYLALADEWGRKGDAARRHRVATAGYSILDSPHDGSETDHVGRGALALHLAVTADGAGLYDAARHHSPLSCAAAMVGEALGTGGELSTDLTADAWLLVARLVRRGFRPPIPGLAESLSDAWAEAMATSLEGYELAASPDLDPDRAGQAGCHREYALAARSKGWRLAEHADARTAFLFHNARALSLYEALEDLRGQAGRHREYAVAARDEGWRLAEHADAQAAFVFHNARALSLYLALEDLRGQANCHDEYTVAARDTGWWLAEHVDAQTAFLFHNARALSLYEANEHLSGQVGCHWHYAAAARFKGWWLVEHGDARDAFLFHLAHALTLYGALDDRAGQASCNFEYAVAALERGWWLMDRGDARTAFLFHIGQALTLYGATDHRSGQASCNRQYAAAARLHGWWLAEHADAQAAFMFHNGQALGLYEALDDRSGQADCHIEYAAAARERRWWLEEHADARAAFLFHITTACRLSDVLEHRIDIALCHLHMALAAREQGWWPVEHADERAAFMFHNGQALGLYEALDDRSGQAACHRNFALAAREQGWWLEHADASIAFLFHNRHALRLYEALGVPVSAALCHRLYAIAASDDGVVPDDRPDARTAFLHHNAKALELYTALDRVDEVAAAHHRFARAARYKQWWRPEYGSAEAAAREHFTRERELGAAEGLASHEADASLELALLDLEQHSPDSSGDWIATTIERLERAVHLYETAVSNPGNLEVAIRNLDAARRLA